MTRFQLTYDMWCPPFATTSLAGHYAAMLDQCAYADHHGFELVQFNEHHASIENYLPSPLVAAAAVAGRTSRMLTRTLLLAPFYDPVKLAEDIAVADLLSGGRMVPVLAGGYRLEEYAMFGQDIADRRGLVDGTAQFLRRAWTGEPVELDGRTVRVRPTPAQDPHPPIVMGGTSGIAARAAARYADDFLTGSPKWWEVYRAERIALGGTDPGSHPTRAPFAFMHVSEDPERDRPRIAPYLLSAIRVYREWTVAGGSSMAAALPHFSIVDEDELRASAQYLFVTPDECVALLDELPDDIIVGVNPGWGGYDPDLAWESLTLLVEKVIPRMAGGAVAAERGR